MRKRRGGVTERQALDNRILLQGRNPRRPRLDGHRISRRACALTQAGFAAIRRGGLTRWGLRSDRICHHRHCMRIARHPRLVMTRHRFGHFLGGLCGDAMLRHSDHAHARLSRRDAVEDKHDAEEDSQKARSNRHFETLTESIARRVKGPNSVPTPGFERRYAQNGAECP